jgi:hypothetical protein
MAAANFSPAPEVKEFADKLIPKYHGHLVDFSVRIEYVFIDKVPKKGGKEVWGYVTKVTNLHAFLSVNNPDSEPYFAMVISKPIWDILSDNGKTALIDHELCHCGAELTEKDEQEVVKLTLVPHDMEEFLSINRRYGNWQDTENIGDSKEKTK